MTAENGNGELRQLLEIKRAYRRGLASLEEELKAKFERELADGKKRLREEYLENVVDAVFAEPAPVQDVKPEPKPEPAVAPEVEAKQPDVCPECEAPVNPTDKFCGQCAYPLKELPSKEAGMSEYPVVTAGRKLRAQRRA